MISKKYATPFILEFPENLDSLCQSVSQMSRRYIEEEINSDKM